MKNSFKYFSLFKLSLLVLLILFLFFSNYLRNFIDINFILNKIYFYKDFIDENIFVLSFFFIFIFILWVSFLLPLITFLQIISGFFYGPYVGTLISLLSIIIGSFIIYSYPINKLKLKILNSKKINLTKIKENLNKNEFFYLMLIRVLPGIPFFLQGVIASYFKVNKFKYFISTLIGLLPISLLINFFGSEINQTVVKHSFEINFQKNIFYYFPLVLLIIIYGIRYFIPKIFKRFHL